MNYRRMYKIRVEESFPEGYEVRWGGVTSNLRKARLKLRYGTNPNQRAALYVRDGSLWNNIKELKSGKSGLSQTNIEDVDHALRILKYFKEPACAVMKHLIPSGFAASRDGESLLDVYVRARDCDSQAAFGSVVVFNSTVDGDVAEEVSSTYVEVVAAPMFEDEALEVFKVKRQLRVVEYPVSSIWSAKKFVGDLLSIEDYEISSLSDGSIIISDPFLTKVREPKDIEVVTDSKPNDRMVEDMIFAWYVSIGVRSNGIVIARDKGTLSIGAGQQDRVTAVKIAVDKACDRGHRDGLNGSVLASDGFIPFRDSIDVISNYGVAAVIQPGGSVRDEEVIKACDEYGIVMAFTGERTFGHF